MLTSRRRSRANSIALAPLIRMPTSATQITVSPATGIGAAKRLIASQAIPPVTTNRSAAFSSATRIDELRRP